MKYTNRADLLEAAAKSIRMQESAGITPVCKLDKFGIILCEGKVFDQRNNADWQFPLAVVEGKPVFVGDELYYKDDGMKCVAIRSSGRRIIVNNEKYNDCGEEIDDLSWNPPKPKIAAVELRIEVIEYLAARDCDVASISEEITFACRKALATLK